MFYFPQKIFLATLLEQKDQLAISNLILLISFDFSYKSPVLFSCHNDFKKRPTSYIWDENTFDFQCLKIKHKINSLKLPTSKIEWRYPPQRQKELLFDPSIVCERVTVRTQQRAIPFFWHVELFGKWLCWTIDCGYRLHLLFNTRVKKWSGVHFIF